MHSRLIGILYVDLSLGNTTDISFQVAQLVCQMSNNEDGIRIVRYAAIQVDKLAPQV